MPVVYHRSAGQVDGGHCVHVRSVTSPDGRSTRSTFPPRFDPLRRSRGLVAGSKRSGGRGATPPRASSGPGRGSEPATEHLDQPDDTQPEAVPGCGFSRRAFLGGVGATTASAALLPTAAAAGPQDRPSRPTDAVAIGGPPNTFGRLFPHLEPFAEDSTQLRDALMDIGRPGGMMDANDDLAAGPVALIADLSLSERNRNNPAHTASTSFVGQFIDHDLTRDLSSPLGIAVDPEDHMNNRHRPSISTRCSVGVPCATGSSTRSGSTAT